MSMRRTLKIRKLNSQPSEKNSLLLRMKKICIAVSLATHVESVLFEGEKLCDSPDGTPRWLEFELENRFQVRICFIQYL